MMLMMLMNMMLMNMMLMNMMLMMMIMMMMIMIMMMMMMMMMHRPSSLRVRAKPRHLPYIYIYTVNDSTLYQSSSAKNFLAPPI